MKINFKKNNYKLMLTPKHSKKLQKALFKLGYIKYDSEDKVLYRVKSHYLYIETTKVIRRDSANTPTYFDKQHYTWITYKQAMKAIKKQIAKNALVKEAEKPDTDKPTDVKEVHCCGNCKTVGECPLAGDSVVVDFLTIPNIKVDSDTNPVIKKHIFKVGDKAIVRDWGDMEAEYGVDDAGDINTGLEPFVEGMRKYCGHIVTLCDIYRNGFRAKETSDWSITPEMLKPCVEPVISPTPNKLKVDDDLQDLKCCGNCEYDCAGSNVTPDGVCSYWQADTLDFSERLSVRRLN